MGSAVEEIRGLGPRTHDCPACDGIMPVDAITYGRWRLVHGTVDPYFRRVVSMHCPHCDHQEALIQRRSVQMVA